MKNNRSFVLRYWIYGATILLWGSAIGLFVTAYQDHHLLKLIPIIAYNRPQGAFGWSLTLAVIFSFVSFWAFRQHKFMHPKAPKS